MKTVGEHLASAAADRRTLISFEIVQPKRGGSFTELTALIERLAAWNPPFIDVTSHAAEVLYEETPEGLQRRIVRKRPGTEGIALLIQDRYGIDAVPHVVAGGFTPTETEDFLFALDYFGIRNILAVRGEPRRTNGTAADGRPRHAVDLVRQIRDMNRGRYVEDVLYPTPTDFCIGVAGYPERHPEAPNLETDICHLLEKVEAGADYIVTQMCFDTEAFFRFEAACRSAGITVPIVPGLKVIHDRRQLETLPGRFNTTIPVELSNRLERASSQAEVQQIGIEWAAAQVEALMARGVPAIHFFVMWTSDPVEEVLSQVLGRICSR